MEDLRALAVSRCIVKRMTLHKSEGLDVGQTLSSKNGICLHPRGLLRSNNTETMVSSEHTSVLLGAELRGKGLSLKYAGLRLRSR